MRNYLAAHVAKNCRVHCGYEPSATLGLDALPGDTWANIAFHFWKKSLPGLRGPPSTPSTGSQSKMGTKPDAPPPNRSANKIRPFRPGRSG